MTTESEEKQVTWGDIAEIVVCAAVFRRLLNNKDTLYPHRTALVTPINERMVLDVIKNTTRDLKSEFIKIPVPKTDAEKKKAKAVTSTLKRHGENNNSSAQDILTMTVRIPYFKAAKVISMLSVPSENLNKQIKKCVEYANKAFTGSAEKIYTNGVKDTIIVAADGTTNQNVTKADVTVTETTRGAVKQDLSAAISVKDQTFKVHTFNVKKNLVSSDYRHNMKMVFDPSGLSFLMTEDQYNELFTTKGQYAALNAFMRSVRSKPKNWSDTKKFILKMMYRNDRELKFLSLKNAKYKLSTFEDVRLKLEEFDEKDIVVGMTNEKMHETPTVKVTIHGRNIFQIRVSKSDSGFTLIAEIGPLILDPKEDK